MSKFEVAAEVFEKLPTYCLGVVVARGVDNGTANVKVTQMMNDEMNAFVQRMVGVNLKEYPGIQPYRNAFLSLGMNPNKFMCSVEALSKRVQKGNRLPNINPIVDLGNALSLKYCLPMGAHDIEKLDGDMTVRFSTTEDYFLPMGENEAEQMPDQELVYVSNHTVKTRRWIWRQSDDGKIDEKTGYIFYPIDGFVDANLENVKRATAELAKFLAEEFGCEVKTGFIDSTHTSVEFF